MKAKTERPTGKDPIVWLLELDDDNGKTCYLGIDCCGVGFQYDKRRALQFTEDSATRAAPFISHKVRVVPHPAWAVTMDADEAWPYDMDDGEAIPGFYHCGKAL